MTPNEILNRYWLARIIGWRYELELLDAETVAILIKALKSSNNLLRQKIAEELPAIWDNYTAEKGGAAVRLWLGDLLTDPAMQIENTITDAWVISGQSSFAAYNDILSVNGLAKNVATVPVTMDAIKGLADKKLFAGYTLGQLVAKAFTEGQIASVIETLDNGIKEGMSYPKIIKALNQTALDAGAQITQRESITLARSYIQQASVNAQLAVYERNKRIIKGVKWCAILDSRVCPLCAVSDGNHYTFSEERPPMPRHPRCLLPDTPVVAPDTIAGFIAEYDGPVYDIKLENGASFSITIDHPIMTEAGFLPATLIDQNFKIVCRNKYVNSFGQDKIKKIVNYMTSFSWNGKENMPLSKYGLHGAGAFCDGQVQVIRESQLGNINFDERFDLYFALECDKRLKSVSEIPDGYTIFIKWLESHKGILSLQRIVEKKERHYKGKVYDLQTLSSMYYADGAIVSNCRCLWLPWVKSWRDVGIDVDDLEKAARPWLIREQGNIDQGGNRKILYAGTTKEDFGGWWATLPFDQQAQIIGPVRTRLIREGKLKWSELMDKNSGKYFTLHELGFTENGKKIVKNITFMSNKDFIQAAEQIINPYLKNGELKEIIFEKSKKDYMMATNGRGTFWISGGKQDELGNIELNTELKNIWGKAASGKYLEQHEEQTLQCFWHEIIHNRQFGHTRSSGTKSDMLGELSVEWTARRTYPDFLEKIGTKAQHQEYIENNSPGYYHRVKNFDDLCKKLGVNNKNDMLIFMKDMIENKKVKDYPKEILEYLNKNKTKNISKGEINKALGLIQYSNFSDALKWNKINLE